MSNTPQEFDAEYNMLCMGCRRPIRQDDFYVVVNQHDLVDADTKLVVHTSCISKLMVLWASVLNAHTPRRSTTHRNSAPDAAYATTTATTMSGALAAGSKRKGTTMSDVVQTVCESCRSGRHPHDTWGPNASEVRSGERRIGDDAGCPNLAGSQDCRCRHVNRPRGGRPHPHCPTCRCDGGC